MSDETRTNPETAAPPAAPQPATSPVDGASRITFDEFMRVDIRAARVVAAERVPKSKKLLRLEVDLGNERRILVAGLGEAYAPETLVGKVVPIVANLAPATLMGVQSNGMILAASVPGGAPIVLSFDSEPALGSRIK